MNHFPLLIGPLDKEQMTIVEDTMEEWAVSEWDALCQMFDDEVSGFWLAKPAKRRELYLSHDPVFVLPDLDIEQWLQGPPFDLYVVKALEAHYIRLQPPEPPPPQAQVDPATGQPGYDQQTVQLYQQAHEAWRNHYASWERLMQRLAAGQAEPVDFLTDWWTLQFTWPRVGERMMKDYASLLKAAI